MLKCEICKKSFTSLDNHHIISKSKGGTNNKYNITKLCQNCHKKCHIGEINILGKFLSTNGYILRFDLNPTEIDENCYIIGKQ